MFFISRIRPISVSKALCVVYRREHRRRGRGHGDADREEEGAERRGAVHGGRALQRRRAGDVPQQIRAHVPHVRELRHHAGPGE